MPTLTITVAKIEPPLPGKQKAKIIGVAGERIYAFPDKAAKFTPGHAYEVDYSTSEWNGKTFNNLESFHEIEGAKATAAIATAAATAGTKDEQIFCVALLKSLIESGEVKNDKKQLFETTVMLRKLWHHTFGDTTFVVTKDGPRQLERVA